MKKTLLILSFILLSVVSFAQRQRTTAIFDADTTTRPKTGFYGIGVRASNVYFVPTTGNNIRLANYSLFTGLTTNYLPKWNGSKLVNSAIYESSGNVGIGTASPSSNFEILSGTTNTEIARFTNTATSRGLTITGFAVGGTNEVGYNINAPGAGGNAAISFSTLSLEAMRIAPSGNVGIGTTSPDASAKLHVSSTTQGVLITRGTTAQINAISSPANGLMVYNTTLNKLCVYENGTWNQVTTTTM